MMGQWFAGAIERLAGLVWGPAMLALLLGAGLYFTLRGRFMQITKWREIWRHTFGGLFRGGQKKSGGVTPFQAVSTALASTVGTGNIVGVAAAMMAGGPGAIFWMWVSAFLGMMTKYAEVVLAQLYRRPDGRGGYMGGPMYVIRDGLNSRLLAGLFAVLGLLASFGVGNMIQAGAISQAVCALTNVPAATVGLVTMMVTALVILGGARAVVRVTEKLTPFMAGMYILATLIIILLNIENIPRAFALIIKDAFQPVSAAAGVGGFLLSRTMRVGLARGVFSNEAGLGSSAIAHAAADAEDPVRQGFWGHIEVFVDTIVMCTLTALAILTSGVFERWRELVNAGVLPALGSKILSLSASPGGDGPNLALYAFTGAFGPFGGVLLGVSTALFAIGTIMGWNYYGEVCCRYLFEKNEKRAILFYRICYIAAVYVGATLNLNVLWSLCDALNGLMAVPNLIALFLLSGVVFKATRRYLGRTDNNRNTKDGTATKKQHPVP